jgi:hypothetical protein
VIQFGVDVVGRCEVPVGAAGNLGTGAGVALGGVGVDAARFAAGVESFGDD